MQHRHTLQHRIVVIGAGYAGAAAAGRLARRLRPGDASLTLVNAEPDFVERVRLHQLAAGQELAPRPLHAMFAGTGVALRHARVTAVDVERRTVSLTAARTAARGGDTATPPPKEELEYDTLVYALGSTWHTHGVPGAEQHAHDVAGRAGALRLRARLAALGPGAAVVVVGGGLTGVEAAAEIAESRPDLDVSLVARGPLGDWLSPKGGDHLRRVFARLGVTVHERTDVTAVASDHLRTADGRSLPAAATVWTTGFAVHPLARDTALTDDPAGRIVVDAAMRSVSHPDVHAVGDAALVAGPGGAPLRMSCASGIPTAWQAADSIAAALTGTRAGTAPLRYVNQCVSLGRGDGLIQYVTADDRAKRSALTGRTAALYKELVCRGAAWSVAHPTLGLPVRRRALAPRPARPDRPGTTADTRR
ncbi:NAD(P)/FAD-dependent oxidoreductase [Streptomyces lonarensis]|uniref:FAD-dependent oxidoreductase n=1 Tax=Streptomyces lonarensis TaxID=700599 RepID=A0A7X6D374_9ACTN|nr:FAD-dependent oxidoreductase [Streptomyces lonarensis]NJQ07342.1 FAD-dependent oxidoreductase [Streptomyces lonarensis]